jgi:hypothetical protein
MMPESHESSCLYVVTFKKEMIVDEPHFARLPHTCIETEEGAERLFLDAYCALRLRPHVPKAGKRWLVRSAAQKDVLQHWAHHIRSPETFAEQQRPPLGD